jgi:hypothetical protein
LMKNSTIYCSLLDSGECFLLCQIETKHAKRPVMKCLRGPLRESSASFFACSCQNSYTNRVCQAVNPWGGNLLRSSVQKNNATMISQANHPNANSITRIAKQMSSVTNRIWDGVPAKFV